MFFGWKRKKPYVNRGKTAKRAKPSSAATSYRKPSTGVVSKVSPRLGSGNQLYATLIYANTFTLDSAASTTVVQQFSLNNLEDVDVTGGDAEPSGYDQLKGLYNNFTVLKCEYKVTASCLSSGAQVVAVGVTDTVTPPTSARQVIENGSAQWKFTNVATSATDPVDFNFSDHVDLDKLFGVSLENLKGEDAYSHSSTASPADQGYLNITLENLDAADRVAIRFYIELRYYVLCRGAALVGVSS